MFRSSPLQVVNFRSGGKSDIKKKGERRRMFLKSTYSFFFSFLLFFLWSGSGTSREVVSALNSRANVISLLVIVFTCFLGSLFVLTGPVHSKPEYLSLHRLQIRHSKILLILARPLPIGYLTFYYYFFFWFLTGWIAWRRVYTFCMWQPTSQHPVWSFIVNS